MNSYQDFLSICDWGETLAEQRERIITEIMTPQQLEARRLFFEKNQLIEGNQLKLF